MSPTLKPIAVVLLGSLSAFGQAPVAPPAFEVASIKPSDPTQPIAIKRSGNHFASTSTSLEWLITWAYDVHNDRLFGKPKWLDSVRYDVVANAPNGPAIPRRPGQPGPLQLMMQTLLADRFKLVIHREIRELPTYALVVAKSGPKVHPVAATGEMSQNPFNMPGRGHLIGTQVSTEMLAKVLSSQLTRSVQDRTGLNGVFDFTLQWEPEMQAAGPESLQGRTGASLFTALQEQLGLKLEPSKGEVEVLVIDRVESTPTDN